MQTNPIIPYKERDNIAAMMSIWRGVFSWLIIYIDSNRELSAVALNPALSKWSANIDTCTALQNTQLHRFRKSLALGKNS